MAKCAPIWVNGNQRISHLLPREGSSWDQLIAGGIVVDLHPKLRSSATSSGFLEPNVSRTDSASSSVGAQVAQDMQMSTFRDAGAPSTCRGNIP